MPLSSTVSITVTEQRPLVCWVFSYKLPIVSTLTNLHNKSMGSSLAGHQERFSDQLMTNCDH